MDTRFLIIGGGAIGLSTAYALSKRFGEEVALLERGKNIPGDNQSTRSSQVIHAGVFYNADARPYTATNIAEANAQIYEFCSRHQIPYRRTGKLVVAVTKEQARFLDLVELVSKENGVEIMRLTGQEVSEIEPNICCLEAISAPTSGIFDAACLLSAYARLARGNGAAIVTGSEVVGIEPISNGFRVYFRSIFGGTDSFDAENIINAAGLFADQVSKMVNPKSELVLVAVRKLSAVFNSGRDEKLCVRGNIYPAPMGYMVKEGKYQRISFEEFESLRAKGVGVGLNIGVHLTPTLGDESDLGTEIIVGPATTESLPPLRREDYSFIPEDLDSFASAVSPFFPNLRVEHLHFRETASMAYTDGTVEYAIVPDAQYPNFLNLHGMNSPALTMSYFIGEDVARRYLLGKWDNFLR